MIWTVLYDNHEAETVITQGNSYNEVIDRVTSMHNQNRAADIFAIAKGDIKSIVKFYNKGIYNGD